MAAYISLSFFVLAGLAWEVGWAGVVGWCFYVILTPLQMAPFWIDLTAQSFDKRGHWQLERGLAMPKGSAKRLETSA